MRVNAEPQIRSFSVIDQPACLALFDENCPDYFAQNERDEYTRFLDAQSGSYQVCILDDHVVGAYGLYATSSGHTALHWILFSPSVHGRGLGSYVMSRVIRELKEKGSFKIIISASHKSAPFFAKFGATEMATITDGWGPGMHRVEMQIRI